MGSGGGGGTTVQKTEPWDEQKPYLQYGFDEARRLYDQAPAEYYPGESYVPFSQQTMSALEGAEQRARQGSSVTPAASQYATQALRGQTGNPYQALLGGGAAGLGATAAGAHMGGNPYLDQMYGAATRGITDRFSESVLPGIAAQFGSAGRTGGGIHQLAVGRAAEGLAQQLGDVGTRLYGGAYESERGRQQQAQRDLLSTGAQLYGTGARERLGVLGLAPETAKAEYTDYDKLRGIGKTYEGLAERALEDDIRRFNYAQQGQQRALQDYLALISGQYGGTTTSRTSRSGNPLATGLGAAATIGSLFG